jgi:hypothetical protein
VRRSKELQVQDYIAKKGEDIHSPERIQMNDKYILQGHKPIPCEDLLKWAEWYGKADRTVSRTENETGTVSVSTVFLGLNHNFFRSNPPILFETMIFGGKHDGFQNRYSTWEEAEEGHKKTCEFAFKED